MNHFLMKVTLLTLLITGASMTARESYKELFNLPNETKHDVSESRYDYSRGVEQLTEGCKHVVTFKNSISAVLNARTY